ncbi:hypothetical protein V2J09_002080 [Rumex salicifolius]
MEEGNELTTNGFASGTINFTCGWAIGGANMLLAVAAVVLVLALNSLFPGRVEEEEEDDEDDDGDEAEDDEEDGVEEDEGGVPGEEEEADEDDDDGDDADDDEEEGVDEDECGVPGDDDEEDDEGGVPEEEEEADDDAEGDCDDDEEGDFEEDVEELGVFVEVDVEEGAPEEDEEVDSTVQVSGQNLGQTCSRLLQYLNLVLLHLTRLGSMAMPGGVASTMAPNNKTTNPRHIILGRGEAILLSNLKATKEF